MAAKNKIEIKRPSCPKCKTPMRIVSTGIMVQTFDCPSCGETKIVEREGTKK